MEAEHCSNDPDRLSINNAHCKTEKGNGVETVFVKVEANFFTAEPSEYDDPLETSGQDAEKCPQDINSCSSAVPATDVTTGFSDCTIRGKRSEDNQVHSNVDTDEKPFKCRICSRSYAEECKLQRHQRVHIGGKPFKCEVCSKTFRINSYLIAHERVHTGEKPFKCKICSKCFFAKCNLIRHKMIHTGEKPFKCKICSISLSDSSSLKRHEMIHTGAKPFQCSFCSKTFAQGSTLSTHVRVHTGERPFVCRFCSKSFTARSNYLMHEKIHTNKPFHCKYCAKSFAKNSYLEKHEKCHQSKVKKSKSDQEYLPSQKFGRDDTKDSLAGNNSKMISRGKDMVDYTEREDTKEFIMGKIKKEFPGNDDSKEFILCNENNLFIMGDGNKEYDRKGFITKDETGKVWSSENSKQLSMSGIKQDFPLKKITCASPAADDMKDFVISGIKKEL